MPIYLSISFLEIPNNTLDLLNSQGNIVAEPILNHIMKSDKYSTVLNSLNISHKRFESIPCALSELPIECYRELLIGHYIAP